MPYFISQGCDGKNDYWGVFAIDSDTTYGCHQTKSAAIDQAIAISLADDEEFIGERNLAGPDVKVADIDGVLLRDGARVERVWDFLDNISGRLIIVTGRPVSMRDETISELAQADIEYSRLIMNPGSMADSPEYKKATMEKLLEDLNVVIAVDDNADVVSSYKDLGVDAFAPADLPDVIDDDSPDMNDDSSDQMRQVNLTPPEYMQDAARRGLEYYEQGLAGDGVVERTIREARLMASGEVSADKWVRIAAWIARHLVDLDAPAADPDHEDYPSAGVVAHLLWGSGPSKSAAERALEYAQGVVGRIREEDEGRNKGNAVNKIETRVQATNFELRETPEGMQFEGYASVFNSRSENLGGFTEFVAPGAFSRSLKSRNDVKLLWNHDAGQVLGSTRAKSMQLVEDERGLKVTATLPNTQLGRDTAELIRTGIIDSMSFGFNVIKDSWNPEGNERTLHQVRLFEVSIVAFPAYAGTAGTTSVRSVEKLAKRAEVDMAELEAALLKLESGEDLDEAARDLLNEVINKVSPAVETDVEETVTGDLALLALKKKKLQLLDLN